MAANLKHKPPAIKFDENVDRVELSEQKWQELLDAKQFHILRNKGTERAFSGKYDKFYEAGTYICAGCGNPLFSSNAKFDSKSGWPSFWQPVSDKSIKTQEDNLLIFIKRTEVICNRCNGHLGHVFSDGPEPTGLRYCINSLALSFIPSR